MVGNLNLALLARGLNGGHFRSRNFNLIVMMASVMARRGYRLSVLLDPQRFNNCQRSRARLAVLYRQVAVAVRDATATYLPSLGHSLRVRISLFLYLVVLHIERLFFLQSGPLPRYFRQDYVLLVLVLHHLVLILPSCLLDALHSQLGGLLKLKPFSLPLHSFFLRLHHFLHSLISQLAFRQVLHLPLQSLLLLLSELLP